MATIGDGFIMPALFKSVGAKRRSEIGTEICFGDTDQCRGEGGRASESRPVEDAHDLSFRSAVLIGQARRQAGILFVGFSSGAGAASA